MGNINPASDCGETAICKSFISPLNLSDALRVTCYSGQSDIAFSKSIIPVYNTLVNKEEAAGNYEVKFDGSRLSSGIYFYRIKAGDYTATKKLNLLK